LALEAVWGRFCGSGWAVTSAAKWGLAFLWNARHKRDGLFSDWLGLCLADREDILESNWRYLIPIGFIGGYTTFSSFEYETLRSIQDGQVGLGLLYVATSVIFGFIAVWGGMIAGRAIV